MARKRAPAPQFPRTVAIINSNDDLVRIVREVLEDEGYNAVSGHVTDIKSGKLDLERFLAKHQPDAVVYDIAPPYYENWTFLQRLLRRPEFRGPVLIITTVNKRALEREVGRTDAFEVVGTRAGLAPLVDAVNRRVRWAIEHTTRPAPDARPPAKRRPLRTVRHR